MTPARIADERVSSALDLQRSQDALDLAQLAIGLSEPNPRVGCVIGREDGVVLGRGHTQAAGGPHAEVVALRDAEAQGHDIRGASVWVSLEPCAHHGRTPPCCEALAAAAVARVVVAMRDPNPLVNGRGIDYLRAKGIRVAHAVAEIEQQARELNIGFVSRHERGRPWVRVKAAQSMDGRIALLDGTSRWITCAESRADGQRWRRRAGAIVTGIGTVLADDPRLDCRIEGGPQPLRVVLDSHWRTPHEAALLRVPGPVLVLGVDCAPDRRLALTHSAETLVVASEGDHLSLGAAVSALSARKINEVHVEAGPKVNGALLQENLIDEWLLYLAPHWLGPGKPVVELPSRMDLPTEPDWMIVETSAVGSDLRLRLRRDVSAAPGGVSKGLTSGSAGTVQRSLSG